MVNKYNEDLDYLIKNADISVEELKEIIAIADKIISDPNIKNAKLIEAHLKKVQCLHKLGKFEESNVHVDKLLEYDPGMPGALAHQAIIYDENEKYDKAIQYFTEAIKEHKKQYGKEYCYAYVQRGHTYSSRNDFFKAMRDFNKAAQIRPAYALIFNQIAWTYIFKNDYEKALKNFDKAIKLKPDYGGCYYGKGYIYQYIKRDYDKAIENYTKTIEKWGNDAIAYAFRAISYKEIAGGDKALLQKALKDLASASKLNSDKDLGKLIKSERNEIRAIIGHDWKLTDDRFIAYFDIMGFKDLVAKNSHKEVLDKLSELIESVNETGNNIKPNNSPSAIPYRKNPYLVVTTFSDSIIFFSKDGTINSLKEIINSSKRLMNAALKLAIPIKGVIAYGMLSVDILIDQKQIFCGQPLIDAYLLEQELYYYGAIFHNSFDKFIIDNKKQFDVLCKNKDYKNVFVETKIPIKMGGAVNHLNLNWFENIDSYDFSEVISKFKATTSGNIRKYIDNTIDMFMKINPSKKVFSTNELLDFRIQLLNVEKLLKGANYKTFSKTHFPELPLPFLALAVDEVLILGDILPNIESDTIINSVDKLNAILDKIQLLFEEFVDKNLMISILKLIVIPEHAVIDQHIQDKLHESNIQIVCMEKKKDNYILKVIPKKSAPSADKKENFEAFVDFLRTVIDWFEK